MPTLRPHALLAAALAGCIVIVDGRHGDGPLLEGDGVATSEERPVEDIAAISLEGPIDLEGTGGSEPFLRVHADGNVLEHLETSVRSGRLVIRLEPGYAYRLRTRPRVELGLRSLESVSIAGSSDVRLEDLEGARLALHVAGSAEIVARGRVDELLVSIAGAGDVDAGELAAERASISIAGSGDVLARVERELAVEIAGAGDVRFHGDAEVSARINGSGDVTRLR